MTKTIWAVGGGKGGTGKSFIASSLGISLGSRGFDVVLVDVDLGAPNMHTILGMTDARPGLDAFFMNAVPSLEDAIIATPYKGLRLIKGAEDLLFMANLNHYKKLKLLRKIKAIDAGQIILDIGTGSSFNSLDFFILADPGILVVTPEPTAIENGYQFLKSCIMRILKLYAEHYKIQDLLQKLVEQIEKDSQSLYSVFQSLAASNGSYAHALYRALRNFRPCLIMNKAMDERDILLGRSIADVVKKYLLIDLRFLGGIPYDERVHWSLKKRTPFIVLHPDSDAASALRAVSLSLAEEIGKSGTYPAGPALLS